jgi:hypothetical protein
MNFGDLTPYLTYMSGTDQSFYLWTHYVCLKSDVQSIYETEQSSIQYHKSNTDKADDKRQ